MSSKKRLMVCLVITVVALSLQVCFVSAATLPDVQPTQIFGPTSIKLGTSAFYDSGVRNNGGTNSGGFNVKWYIIDYQQGGVWKQVGYGSHTSVPANSTVLGGNSYLTWKPSAVGTYKVVFYVDCDNHVVESNESNNMWKTVTITVTN